jgi:hypothetical protein
VAPGPGFFSDKEVSSSMNRWISLLVLVFPSWEAAFSGQISPQALLVDHRPSQPIQKLRAKAGQAAFVADEFSVGREGETWMIDRLRLWIVLDPAAARARTLGEVFRTVSLYGGVAPETDSDPADNCDCHNLPSLEAATFPLAGDVISNREVTVSQTRLSDGVVLWQLEFGNLRWSVPGGIGLVFGLAAEPRFSADVTWFYSGYSSGSDRPLYTFSATGKLVSPKGNAPNARMNVQVWGHAANP